MYITIFGAGAYGNALSHILKENDHEVTFYDPFEFPEISLEKSLENAEVLILAIPSSEIPNLLSKIPAKYHQLPLICTSKGLISLEVFNDFTNFHVLSGPAFAEDLAAEKPSILTASSSLPIRLFSTPWLRVEKTSDVFGIMLCGTLKNIYAIMSGYKELTPSSKLFLPFINSAADEMRAFFRANHCNAHTVDLACGLPDLILTCSSEKSRNYTFGTLLKKSGPTIPRETVEGYSAILEIKKSSSFIIPENTPLFKEISEKISSSSC